MEPVFMILGQSAATAASLAIDARASVQRVDYTQLKAQLLQDAQILEWTGPAHPGAVPKPKLEGLVLDDTVAQKFGGWTPGSLAGTERIGEGYIHDHNENKGQLGLRWTPEIPAAGKYEIIFHFPPNPNRATNVPVTITIGGAEGQVIRVNEREKTGQQSLGKFDLPAGHDTTIGVSNRGTDGYVVVDGVQIIKADR
jgi:hypothetical protein